MIRSLQRSRAVVLTLLLLTLVAWLIVPPASAEATRTLTVARGGSGDCVGTPCGSIAAAYGVANGGDVIELSAGTYPEERLTSARGAAWSRNVEVRPAPGATVILKGLESLAPRLTLADLRVEGSVKLRPGADDNRLERLDLQGSAYISAHRTAVIDSRVQPRLNNDGIQIKPLNRGDTPPRDVLVVGNDIGPGYLGSGSSAHVDSIQVMGVEGLRIEGNRVREASSLTLLIKPDLGDIRDVVVRENLLEQCAPRRDDCRGYYAGMVRTAGSRAVENVAFERNTVDSSIFVDPIDGLRVEENVFVGAPTGNAAFRSNLVAPGARGHDETAIVAHAEFSDDGMTLLPDTPGYGWGLSQPVPVEVTDAPVEPAPSEPPPLDPDPVPSDPVPSDPAPSEPVPSDPVPSDPVPSDPAPPEPAPSEPVPSEPVPSDPSPSDPAPVESPDRRPPGLCRDLPRQPRALSDVGPGHAHGPAIRCAHVLGLVRGHADGTFRPGVAITRGQFATMVDRLLSDTDAHAFPPGDTFRDVGTGHPHHAAIARLAGEGILNGYQAGEFGPDETVSRAQAASIIARAVEDVIGADLPPGRDAFDDDDGSVHEAAIDRVAAKGWVLGVSERHFRPNRAVERAQMASILVRVGESLHVEGYLDHLG